MSVAGCLRFGVLLAGAVTACSDVATITSTTITSTTTPTSAANTTNPPATTVPGLSVDLMVQQILLRYDGQNEFGTLEITVCNTGEASAAPSEVEVTVSGAQFAMPAPGEILTDACADVFDPATDFSSFGIAEPGPVEVSASVISPDAGDPADNNTLTQTVSVEHLTTMNANPADYDACVAEGASAEACTALVYLFDPLSDPHQIKKQLGLVTVITDVDHQAVASWLVASSTMCARYVEEYLGAPVPNPFSFHASVVTDPTQELFGAVRTDRIMWRTNQPTLDLWASAGMLRDLWSDIHDGRCLTTHAHEITHLHVGNTPIPSWINEGLATYLEGTPGGGQASTTLVECTDDGWREANVTHPYIALAGPYDPNRTRDYYLTGACFWEYFERTYGHAALQQVVAALVAVRDPVYSHCGPEFEASGFLRDFVQPIIGEDLSALTEQRFGFGSLWNSCEG